MRDSHGHESRMDRGRRVLSWYDPAERDYAIHRTAERRKKRCSMRPPMLHFPCFLCGASCWRRRIDLTPVCDACRPAAGALRRQQYAKIFGAYYTWKFRHATNPEAVRQIDRRSYHAKEERRRAAGLPPRDRSDRKPYLGRWQAARSDWDMVRHRENGRAHGRAQDRHAQIRPRIRGGARPQQAGDMMAPTAYDPETGDHEHRKSSGSYYTTPGAAALLSALALGPSPDNSECRGRTARICDPACGSGIILEAAAKQARANGAARIELYGADINADAVGACRRRLEGLADVIDIRLMPFGPQPDGSVRLGSLELMRDGSGWPWEGAMDSPDMAAAMSQYRESLDAYLSTEGGPR